jgi:hypothetical protein
MIPVLERQLTFSGAQGEGADLRTPKRFIHEF